MTPEEQEQFTKSQTKFLQLINAEKFGGVEFANINDEEYLKARGYESKTGYLISNLLIAVENIQRETGYHTYQLMNVKKPTEKMKKKLVFIAAVCEELLREE